MDLRLAPCASGLPPPALRLAPCALRLPSLARMLTRSAFLRVYLPDDLTTMAVAELPPAAERPALDKALESEFGLLSESLREDAFIAEYKGERFTCPRYPRLRVLEGLLAFFRTYSDFGGNALIPESTAKAAAAELERLRDNEPHQRSHILTSPWHVPLRWFVVFDPDDRELVRVNGGVSVRYRTRRMQASERLDRAIGVLAEAGFDDSVLADVRDLNEWLGAFPGDCLVELDYASVASMFDQADLVLDDSSADVWASIEALDIGDWEAAGRHYGSVAVRWADAMATAYAN